MGENAEKPEPTACSSFDQIGRGFRVHAYEPIEEQLEVRGPVPMIGPMNDQRQRAPTGLKIQVPKKVR